MATCLCALAWRKRSKVENQKVISHKHQLPRCVLELPRATEAETNSSRLHRPTPRQNMFETRMLARREEGNDDSHRRKTNFNSDQDLWVAKTRLKKLISSGSGMFFFPLWQWTHEKIRLNMEVCRVSWMLWRALENMRGRLPHQGFSLIYSWFKRIFCLGLQYNLGRAREKPMHVFFFSPPSWFFFFF